MYEYKPDSNRENQVKITSDDILNQSKDLNDLII